jgi:hypothetical protein
MEKKWCTEEQIVNILKEIEIGKSGADVSCDRGVT